MKRRFLFYVMILSVPFFLALVTWQSARYGDLERELARMEEVQEEWVENNKRLIAGIVFYSSPQRIERIAREELGLRKKPPEEVLQIFVDGEAVND
ncbi:MAG: cell division protein FtsL [Treponema sp.]|nr:cell division protein FtsL [Treponema sp.]